MQPGSKDYDHAIDRLNRGRSGEGLQLLLALHRRDPGDARATRSIAQVYAEAGDFDRAMYFAERTLALRQSKSKIFSRRQSESVAAPLACGIYAII